jgi:hypothetical protein
MLLLLLSSHDFALVVRGLPNRTKMDRAVGSDKVLFSRGRNKNKLLRRKNKGILFHGRWEGKLK